MNTRDLEEQLEDLERWLEDIKKEPGPIVVEGSKDIEALRNLGIGGEILKINQGDSMVVFCERLAGRERVIVLTDWDRKGGHLARILSEGLQANGVKYDMEYRARLSRIVKRDIKDVEGVYSHYHRLKTEWGEKLASGRARRHF
ncbi:MAG: topoisomerase [Candidatus Thermoplasmatota archaeon]|nr:topoisomerase [Candidatus Thermoplasmatota archaeon]